MPQLPEEVLSLWDMPGCKAPGHRAPVIHTAICSVPSWFFKAKEQHPGELRAPFPPAQWHGHGRGALRSYGRREGELASCTHRTPYVRINRLFKRSILSLLCSSSLTSHHFYHELSLIRSNGSFSPTKVFCSLFFLLFPAFISNAKTKTGSRNSSKTHESKKISLLWLPT